MNHFTTDLRLINNRVHRGTKRRIRHSINMTRLRRNLRVHDNRLKRQNKRVRTTLRQGTANGHSHNNRTRNIIPYANVLRVRASFGLPWGCAVNIVVGRVHWGVGTVSTVLWV